MLLLTPGMSWMQMLPDAPVKNFMVPFFSQEGYTEKILKGRELEYISEDLILIRDMHLQVLSANEDQSIITEIKSPAANFLLKENKANSNSSIQIRGPNFNISGVNWEWDGTSEVKKVTIHEWASVTFYEELENFLK